MQPIYLAAYRQCFISGTIKLQTGIVDNIRKKVLLVHMYYMNIRGEKTYKSCFTFLPVEKVPKV